MGRDPERSGVKATETTLRILQCLHDSAGATLTEIANETDVGTSTVHRHLATLQDNGYVVTEGGEHYLGLQFLTLGGRARERTASHELVDTKVQQISEETGERAQFVVAERDERVYVFTHAGENAVTTDATIGKRGPLYVSAAGKAIVAHLPDRRQEEILAEASFEAGTDRAVAERSALEAELAEVRERGYAFNEQESETGLHAVGVPVTHSDGSVIGAISVSGPANRLKGAYYREELPDLLLGAVNEIELNLKYS